VGIMPPGPPAMPGQPPAIPPMPPGATMPRPPAYARPTYASRRDPQPQYTTPLYNPVVLAPLPFQRNGMLVLAQLLAIVQGILGLITGVNLIRADVFFNNLSPGFPVPGAVNGIFITWGVAVLIIASLVIAAAIRAGHPSQIARWFLAIWEIIAFLTILAALTGNGLGLGFLTLLVVAAAGGAGLAPLLVVLGIQALIIYGLVMHPATNQAFAR
jgi:hypothetical protein